MTKHSGLTANDWAAIAQVIAAAATFALAGVTVWLASSTRNLVKTAKRELDQDRDLIEATKEQAKSMSDQVRATRQPILAPVVDGSPDIPANFKGVLNRHTYDIPTHQSSGWLVPGAGGVWILQLLRNVGNGVALFAVGTEFPLAEGILLGAGRGSFRRYGELTSNAVAPGETVLAAFFIQGFDGEGDTQEAQKVVLTIEYQDAGGKDMTQTELTYWPDRIGSSLGIPVIDIKLPS